MDDKDKDIDKNDYLEEEEDISYEKYKLMLETQKEKEINEFVENKNLTIQEKIIINLERELSQLNLEQKNILFSNDEMLRLYLKQILRKKVKKRKKKMIIKIQMIKI